MDNEISSIAERLKTDINHARLQEISVNVIERFRDKDAEWLSEISRRAGVHENNAAIARVFASVIRVYHPDRLAIIYKQIDSLRESADLDGLRKIESIFIFRIPEGKRFIADREQEFTDETDEDFSYGTDDFGYDETAAPEEGYNDWSMDDEEDEDESPFGRNFTEAVNAHFFGNLDHTVTVSDLSNLDGYLDLSDSDITDLAGLEYCVNLTDLNLSGNSIARIDRIAKLFRLKSLFLSENEIELIGAVNGLHELEELDISFNNIEDISPLLGIESLLYVNAMGNPLTDRGTIETLTAKGVIVVYDI